MHMEGIDADVEVMWTSTSVIHPHLHNQISGPITQARAHQLSNQVSSFLASYSSYLDNGNVYSVLLLRNDGQERNRVYYHMHQTSSPYHVGAGRNHYFGAEIVFYQWCCDTLFCPIGSCIMLSPIRTRPRVGARPSLPEVVLPLL
jgi:hypothetical protein